MLHLSYLTPPEWAQTALSDPCALLLDHLYCEKKAGLRARALIKRYGAEHPILVAPLEELAREEDSHAAICEQLLRERGNPPIRHHGNPYVALLKRPAQWRGKGDLLDQLLIASMIEARSCERFQRLADALRGTGLGRFYEDLFACEARHHGLFVSLAVDLFGEKRARTLLDRVSVVEGQIVAARPWGPFLH